MKEETNSRVNKISRYKKLTEQHKIKCGVCPPNKGCNRSKTSYKRSGGQKPKYKDKHK